MPFTPQVFARKLRDLRRAFESTLGEIEAATGISSDRLALLEAGHSSPTGDEVLILADYFKREFTWLIEDESPDPDENVTLLLRSEHRRLSPGDRRAIAEFIHLCKSQALLEELLEIRHQRPEYSYFPPQNRRIWRLHKVQGADCARGFRQWHNLPPNAVIQDIFSWLRDTGMRVFRRSLGPDSHISGLFVRHPEAGRCILINYSEDVYRQRFSAAHEAGHALMDHDKRYNVSAETDQNSDNLIEIRANAFASNFLMPPELLQRLGSPDEWRRPEKIIEVASRLFVSVPALLSALRRDNLIDEATRNDLRRRQLRLPARQEPELRGDLSNRDRERKQRLLSTGLHSSYVHQGLEAHRRGLISLAKLADMLLVEPNDVSDLAELFGTQLRHA